MTVLEYDARIAELRAEERAESALVQIAIRAAVLAERARNLAGERPDMAGAA